MRDRLAVVVLGYGEEPLLEPCLRAVRQQLRPDDELILVDNGIPDVHRSMAAGLGATILGDGGNNSGFAGGCNLAAAHTDAPLLVFVNSDAVVRPGAVDTLAARVTDQSIGIVGGCLRLADSRDLVNSVGNPLQFLGFTWAGHCGEPATAHSEPGSVAVATGGLFAISHAVWDDLGGFDDMYFAYHEDTDLSLRAWLSGRRVEVEPAAVADHTYEFSRNPRKMYLVERNRLITVLTDYPTPLLRLVLPVLLLTEIPLTIVALLSGWGRQKAAAWWWLLRHRQWLTARRRAVQRKVTVPDSRIASLMVAEIDPPMVTEPPGMAVLNQLLRRYWQWARPRLP